MGWGDELMAAGQAAKVSRQLGEPVCIVDRYGAPRWSDLWENNPHISRSKTAHVVVNGPGARPYIRYPFNGEGHGYTGWRARDHRPVLFIGERVVGDFVLIESRIKANANVNKLWPYWQSVVDQLPGVRFVQCGAMPSLRGVEHVRTSVFLDACRLLNRARLYVGPEGGMHHAAAALNVPAVVVFGGSPSVEATGYPDHINFGGDDPCGKWSRCEHCVQKARSITPDAVAAAIKDLLK